jgi:hypothetical protein
VAITYPSAVGAIQAGTSSPQVPLLPAHVEGDLIILQVVSREDSPTPVHTVDDALYFQIGTTQFLDLGTSGIAQSLWYKFALSDAESPPLVNCPSPNCLAVHAEVFRDVGAVVLDIAALEGTVAAALQFTPGSPTPVTDGAWVISFVSSGGQNNLEFDSGGDGGFTIHAHGSAWTTNQGGDASHGSAHIEAEVSVAPLCLSLVSSLTGSARGIAKQGDFIYTVSGTNILRVVNAAEPYNLLSHGSLTDATNLPTAYDLVVDGDWAFVACDGRVTTIDISAPATPVFEATTGTLAELDGLTCIVKDGDYLFVAGGITSQVFAVLDVSDPTDPLVVGDLSDSLFAEARGIAKIGDFCFVTGQTGDVVVSVDVSTLATPTIADSITDSVLNGASGIDSAGDFLYVTSEIADSLTVIDATDPTDLQIAGSYTNAIIDTPTGVLVEGSTAWVVSQASGTRRLVGLDVTDPADIQQFNTSMTVNLLGATPWRIVKDARYFYVTNSGANLVAVDTVCSGWTEPGSHQDSPEMIGDGIGLSADGDYVYIANSSFLDGWFVVVDVSDPVTPVGAAKFEDNTNLHGAHFPRVDGTDVFLAGFVSNSFVIIDASDPTTPVVRSSLIDAVDLEWAWDIALDVVGEVAFVSTRQGSNPGIASVDISDRDNPTVIDKYLDVSVLGSPAGMVWEGDLLYIANTTGVTNSQLYILDVSNPAAMTFEGLIEDALLDGAVSIKKVGDICYVGTLNRRFVAIDVSDPTDPIILGVWRGSSNIVGQIDYFDIDGDFVYISGSGFVVLDISDPTDITYVYRSPAVGSGGMVKDGDLLYGLERSQARLRIWDLSEAGPGGEVVPIVMPRWEQTLGGPAPWAYHTIALRPATILASEPQTWTGHNLQIIVGLVSGTWSGIPQTWTGHNLLIESRLATSPGFIVGVWNGLQVWTGTSFQVRVVLETGAWVGGVSPVVPPVIPPDFTELPGPPPDQGPFDQLLTRPYRRVDIFNSDRSIFMADAPMSDGGAVSIDYNRDERRMGDIVLWNEDHSLDIGPGGLWYDKIIKCFRGITLDSGDTIYWCIGTFVIDRLNQDNSSSQVFVSMRDETKKMLKSKFHQVTTIAAGTEIATIIRALATNSGITNHEIPATGNVLGEDKTFERGATRWAAAKEIANAYGYELYMKPHSALAMRKFVDPLTAPVTLQFYAVDEDSAESHMAHGHTPNVSTYERATHDDLIYNVVVVTGLDADGLVVWESVLSNDDPESPTSTVRIGDRPYFFTSQFIESQAQADETAAAFLSIHAQEQFEFNVGSAVYPWVEAGNAILIDTDHDVADSSFPTRFLLTSATIPMSLGDMSVSAGRVSLVVGEA